MGNKIYSYDSDFNLDQKIVTDDFGFSNPSCLYADGETLYLCFSTSGQFAKLTHPVATGDYYITLDEEKIDAFDKTITVYSQKRDADIEYIDIDCVSSNGFTAEGDIGRYLLFYGLNTFYIAVSDGVNEIAYTLFVTRSYPSWFTLDDLEGYHEYTKSKDKPKENTALTDDSEKIILLDIGGLNMDGLTITSFSKNASTTVEGSKVRIVLSGASADDPPIIQLAAGEGLVTLSAEALHHLACPKAQSIFVVCIFCGRSCSAFSVFFP